MNYIIPHRMAPLIAAPTLILVGLIIQWVGLRVDDWKYDWANDWSHDWSYDLSYRLSSQGSITNRIVMVYIDKATLDATDSDGLSKYTYPNGEYRLHRKDLAKALTQLKKLHVSKIILDQYFVKPNDEETRNDLFNAIEAFKESGITNILAVADNRGDGMGYEKGILEGKVHLADATLDGGRDQVCRKHIISESQRIPNLSWMAANTGSPQTRMKKPSEAPERRWINYYGKTHPDQSPDDNYAGPFRVINMLTLLENDPEQIEQTYGKNVFQDAVVFIGEGGMDDNVGSSDEARRDPWGQKVYGATVHAVIYANLIRGDWIKRLPPLAELCLLTLTGLILGILATRWSAPVGAVGIGFMGVVVVVASLYLFRNHNLVFQFLTVAAGQVPLASVFLIVCQRRPQQRVFLCHNSKDKEFVRSIRKQFRKQGLKCWMDENELLPGAAYHVRIQQAMLRSTVAVIFVSEHGYGPYQSDEIEMFESLFLLGDCKIIPVLLPNTPEDFKFPKSLMMKHFTHADFRTDYDEPLRLLMKSIKLEFKSK